MNPRNERFNRASQENFTDYHEYLLFSGLPAFNRNRFNNNRTDWLVDYNTKNSHHSLSLRSPIQYLVQKQPDRHIREPIQ